MRQLVVGSAAIVLLVLVSIAVILRGSSGSWSPATGAGSESAPAAAPAPAAEPAAPLEIVRRDLARPELPTPPVIQGPPAPEPRKGSWEAVPPVARASDLGPLGGAVGRGLNELQPLLSACFEQAAPSGGAQRTATVVQDYAPRDDHGTTVLMLEIETLGGAARIVDAPVATWGESSDALVGCAQRVLRGHVVRAPGTQPGSRHRLLFSLLP